MKNRKLILAVCAAMIMSMASCASSSSNADSSKAESSSQTESSSVSESSSVTESSKPDSSELTDNHHKYDNMTAEQIVAKLSLQEKANQMALPQILGLSMDSVKKLLRRRAFQGNRSDSSGVAKHH